MADPIYYLKEADILYRRKDGNPKQLPDEVLHHGGWRPLIGQLTVSAEAYPKPSRRGTLDGGADPSLWTKIGPVDEKKAREVAEWRGLPLTGWETDSPERRRTMAELNDAEHDFMLNNPDANRAIAKTAVKRAIDRGVDPALAQRVYGYREIEPEPDVATLNRITHEVTAGLPPARPDTKKEAKVRKELEKEIPEAIEKGYIITPVAE